MPSKLTKIDIGKRAIYNYHVLGNKNNLKIDMQIVNAWYPQTAHQEEIYILNNLLKLANGRDGEYIELSEHTFPLAFMTAGSIPQTNESGELLGIKNNKNAIQQACLRFEDFSGRKLVTGKPLYLAVNFAGKLELEDQISLSRFQCADISQKLEELLRVLTESADLIENNTNAITNELLELKELIKEQGKPSVIKALSTTNDIASVLSVIIDIVPAAAKFGTDLLKSLKAIL